MVSSTSHPRTGGPDRSFLWSWIGLSETKLAMKQKRTQQIMHARRTQSVMTPPLVQAMAAVALTATKAIPTSAVKVTNLKPPALYFFFYFLGGINS